MFHTDVLYMSELSDGETCETCFHTLKNNHSIPASEYSPRRLFYMPLRFTKDIGVFLGG